jgi:hypothetical protein
MIWTENLSTMEYYNPDYLTFIIDLTRFQKLRKYDVDRESGNFFGEIQYDSNPTQKADEYMSIVTLTGACISLIVSIAWHYNTYKLHRSQSTTLQKALSSLIYIKLILCVLIAYYIRVAEDDTGANSLIKVYLDTIITTLSSIFKTIFWFLAIMISCGWQIYRHILTRSEMRRFIGIYIFIYLSVCFDQILDLMVNHTISNVILFLYFLVSSF